MYEAIIGLEIHAQLLTASKLFCGCAASGADEPNSRTCPVCLGMPGALPVLNAAAVEQAVRAALALGCRVHPVSVFARKNYFYPDLPKGYQITQYEQPLASDGRVSWTRRGVTHAVRIVRVHLEEDAGKSLHEGVPGIDGVTGIDFNRSGVPLAEIVTAPDLRTAEDAAECFRQLRAVLVEAGVCDGNLDEGNLRCDANVSVRRAGEQALGAKTEVKNLNSFRFLQRALEHEIARLTSLLSAGAAIDAATLAWDERAGATVPMRVKEDAREYRYFPEPDLPPLTLAPERVEVCRRRLPEPPEARRARLAAAYALDEDDAALLGVSPASAAYFERVAALANPADAANWVKGELTRRLRESGATFEAVPVPPEHVARLIRLVADGTLSASAAKQVFAEVFSSGKAPDVVVRDLGVALVSDDAALQAWVDEVLRGNPAAAVEYRAGRRGALGFLVGLVMKASGGRANPRLVDRMIRERLDRGGTQ